jgi:ABC-type molybdate transport system substrate-binding protein
VADRRLKAFAHRQQRPRPGYVLILGMIAVLAVIVGMMGSVDKFARNLAYSMAGGKISVYAEVEFQPALEEMAAAFTQETGTRVELLFGKGPALYAQIRSQPAAADLLLARVEVWTDQGQTSDLIAETLPVAQLPPLDAEDDADARTQVRPVTGADGPAQMVSIAVLRDTGLPHLALKFARYVHAYDRGGLVLRRLGFKPSNGDPWAEVPKLTLYADLLLSAAIEPGVSAFCLREGVEVERIYRPAGTLLDRLLDGSRPDLYFSSEQSFMQQVAEKFRPPVTASKVRLMIVTQVGNPKSVQGLASLSQPCLRVGLAHPDKTALGRLTQEALDRAHLAEALEASGNLQPPTLGGSSLMAEMAAGSLDAAVVLASHVAGRSGEFELLEIPDQELPNPKTAWAAVQTVAVAQRTSFPHTAQRLLQALIDAEASARFAEQGFQWTQ